MPFGEETPFIFGRHARYGHNYVVCALCDKNVDNASHVTSHLHTKNMAYVQPSETVPKQAACVWILVLAC